ncbi:hypothetical protein [Streptomyces diastaticus]|uniref:hypothetical protein n=1 Tax=Streptomyces diastaticus TaxID=1956 RepID=UPI00368EACE2
MNDRLLAARVRCCQLRHGGSTSRTDASPPETGRPSRCASSSHADCQASRLAQLRHLETGAALSLIEHHLGRQDLGLERLNDQDLCVLMAPTDDWKDEQDHEEGHIAVVGRVDWTGAEAKSLTGRDLAGPRVPGPRPDHREGARQAVARVPAMRTRRHHISRALG